MASSVDERNDDQEVDQDEKVVLEEDDELDENEYMMLCKNLLASGSGEVSLDWETFRERFLSK